MSARILLLPVVLALLLLSACGFHLRGAVEIPYERLYIGNLDANSTLGSALRRQILAHSPNILTETSKDASAIFRQLENSREREITALNADGRAREYQLRLRYSFRIETPNGEPLSPVASIRLAREVTYDDNQVLSKGQEEEFLWNDMERDLVQQILRRLATFKPKGKPEIREEDRENDNEKDWGSEERERV